MDSALALQSKEKEAGVEVYSTNATSATAAVAALLQAAATQQDDVSHQSQQEVDATTAAVSGDADVQTADGDDDDTDIEEDIEIKQLPNKRRRLAEEELDERMERLSDSLEPHWTSLSMYTGYCKTIEEVNKVVEIVEQETNTSYISLRQNKDFGNRGIKEMAGNRVLFRDRKKATEVIEYDHLPYLYLGTKLLGCHMGANKARKQQERKRELMELQGDVRKRTRSTKKKQCTAQIIIKEVLKFPQFRIESESEVAYRAASTAVKLAISKNSSAGEKRFYIRIPDIVEHERYHSIGQDNTVYNKISPLITDRISQLMSQGIVNVSTIQQQLDLYVKCQLFANKEPPNQLNRHFYPSKRDIRNHVSRMQAQQSRPSTKRIDIESLIEEWKTSSVSNTGAHGGEEHNFYYRPTTSTDDIQENEIVKGMIGAELSQTMLLCYQSGWQKRIMSMYGNEVTFLDPVYRTRRIKPCLYLLLVKTGVGHTIVGAFVLEKEGKEAICEALRHFRAWNPAWNPEFFMTGCEQYDVTAVEHTFPNCNVYYCDFHRDQTWVRWVSDVANGVSTNDKKTLLGMLRSCAHSSTVQQYQKAVHVLYTSDVWTGNEQLRKWYHHKWEPEHQRWVQAFRQHKLHCWVNMNNGVETQKETMKHSHFSPYRDTGLSDLMTLLVNYYLPAQHKRYITRMRASIKQSTSAQDLPSFLHNKPFDVVQHCLKQIANAESFEQSTVFEIFPGRFKVNDCEVRFGGQGVMPFCECKDWEKYCMPCQHFFAVFKFCYGWTWDSLEPTYKNCSQFIVDDSEASLLVEQENKEPERTKRSDLNLNPVSTRGAVCSGNKSAAMNTSSLDRFIIVTQPHQLQQVDDNSEKIVNNSVQQHVSGVQNVNNDLHQETIETRTTDNSMQLNATVQVIENTGAQIAGSNVQGQSGPTGAQVAGHIVQQQHATDDALDLGFMAPHSVVNTTNSDIVPIETAPQAQPISTQLATPQQLVQNAETQQHVQQVATQQPVQHTATQHIQAMQQQQPAIITQVHQESDPQQQIHEVVLQTVSGDNTTTITLPLVTAATAASGNTKTSDNLYAAQQACREQLQRIYQLTYHCNNQLVFEDIKHHLDTVEANMQLLTQSYQVMEIVQP